MSHMHESRHLLDAYPGPLGFHSCQYIDALLRRCSWAQKVDTRSKITKSSERVTHEFWLIFGGGVRAAACPHQQSSKARLSTMGKTRGGSLYIKMRNGGKLLFKPSAEFVVGWIRTLLTAFTLSVCYNLCVVVEIWLSSVHHIHLPHHVKRTEDIFS
mmetsp:Transcript_70847/g.103817  ORF Transcript_70847/g.103817 Transcript_70847/m.103817 type:complete len:157 (-) Transcript_70847:88-558(-)